MKTKCLVILPLLLVSGLVYGQVLPDTVVVRNVTKVNKVDSVVVGVPKAGVTIKHSHDSEGVDTVIVNLGNKGLYVYENSTGDVSVWTSNSKKCSSTRFRSHLSGVGFGINIYLNKDWTMKLPTGYEGMDLNVSKSNNVVAQFAAVNQPIFGKMFGISAAIGTEWHNYRFDDDITLTKVVLPNGEKKIMVTPLDGKVTKTKLTDWWLNFPVAFEVNGGSYNSPFLSIGAIGSVLLNSHTKVVTDDNGKDKSKEWNKLYLNPFRVSLFAKVGYGNFGVYATYSLIQMFQDGKGPELYPFAAGITFNF